MTLQRSTPMVALFLLVAACSPDRLANPLSDSALDSAERSAEVRARADELAPLGTLAQSMPRL